MKHFLPFTLLVLFFWGCQKATYEYAVVCQFPPSSNPEETITLVITDDQGDVAGHFPISLGRSSFNQKFTFDARQASEKFGVSLVREWPFIDSNKSIFIESHCGVPNGASVTIDPEFFAFAPGAFRFLPVQITGVPTIDSLKIYSRLFEMNNLRKNTWATSIFMETGRAFVLHFFANGEKVERTYLLRESIAPTDTLRLNFNELEVGYKVSNLEIKLPADQAVYYAKVNMVSPDYKDYISIADPNQNPNPTTNLSVAKPDAVPNDWLVYVNYVGRYSSSEQFFKPGEPLVVTDPTDFGIVSFTSEPGHSISVKTKGEVDLVRATTYLSDLNGHKVSWDINGSAETFKHLELPELKRFLPKSDLYDEAFKYFTPSLYNIKGYDYEQIRSGFPWRSGGIYPAGRSNLRIIRKDY